jgi:hypothetical protein
MILTINDQTHVLIVCCVIILLVTVFYACDLIHDRYAAPAFGFLFAAVVLQVYNGFLLSYGIAWNIENTTTTWVAMLLIGFFSKRMFEGVLESATMVLGAAFLIVVTVAGQDYIINWLNDAIGINVAYPVILLVATIVIVLLWYVMGRLSQTRMFLVLSTSVILVAGCTLSIKVLIAGGAWDMWDASDFDVELFDDWFYITMGIVGVVYCSVYWYVYKSKPRHSAKAKTNHAHIPKKKEIKWLDVHKLGETDQLLSVT